MEKTLSNKLSNEEYEALIAKTFEGTLVKEKLFIKALDKLLLLKSKNPHK